MDISDEAFKKWSANLQKSTEREFKPKEQFKWDLGFNSVGLLSPIGKIKPPRIVEYSSVYDYCDNLKQSKVKMSDQGVSLCKTKSNPTSTGNLKKTEQNSNLNLDQCDTLEKHKFTSSQSDMLPKPEFTPTNLSLFFSQAADFTPTTEYSDLGQCSNNLQKFKPNSSNRTQYSLTQVVFKGGEKSKPHFPLTMEEVSLVTSVSNWTNTNIRVIGVVLDAPDERKYYFESIDEEGGPYKVLLDIECVPTVPPLGRVLELIAQLYTVDSRPVLRVMIYRDFSQVDLRSFRRADEVLKCYVPMFLKRDPPKQESEGEFSELNESFGLMMNNTLDNFSFSDMEVE